MAGRIARQPPVRMRETAKVVAKLATAELEQVVEVVRQWPDAFPSGALTSLESDDAGAVVEKEAAPPGA